MANNQNVNTVLLENIDNKIPFIFDLITPSKEAAEATASSYIRGVHESFTSSFTN